MAQETNPLLGDRKSLVAGGNLYQAHCALCHGEDARGMADIQTPDLTQLWTQDGTTEGSVFRIIRNGIPGSIMSPQDLLDNQIWSLVSYLRSISLGEQELPDGNNVSGAVLFATRCVACHKVEGDDSLGPNLATVIPQRTLSQLLYAVRNPDASVSARYRVVTIKTREGEEVRGLIRNEDNVSILIMDAEQEMRAFNKFSLEEIVRESGSMMPAIPPTQLTDQQLVDIFDYIRTTNTIAEDVRPNAQDL